MPVSVAAVVIDAAASTVLFLFTVVEAVAEILVLDRPSLTLLTASAITVVTEAAMLEVRILLATSAVLEETKEAAVVSLTRTAAAAVVLLIDALAEASTILASRAANGADARGLKPSISLSY